jgi:hypothetical protein
MVDTAQVSVVWKDDIWRKAVIPHLNLAVTAAAGEMRNEAFRALTVKQSPPTSRPGEIPHRDTGNLSEHLAVVSPTSLGTPLRAMFGTSVWYGRTLELGGYQPIGLGRAEHEMDMGRQPFNAGEVFIAARPWIVRSAMAAKVPAFTAFWAVARNRIKAAGLSL